MVEKSLVDDEDWTDGDTVTAAELNNHAAEHNAMYNGTTGEVVADVNNPSVATEDLQYALNNTGYSNRLSDRPLVSTQDRDITVGTDTSTIQEALNEIPFLLRHNYVIRVPDGTYTEDLLVPPFLTADTAGIDDAGAGVEEGATQNPWIRGNTTDPTLVQVNSITVASTNGSIAPIIEGFNPTGTAPHMDESAACVAFGCQDVSFRHMSFVGTAADVGVFAYSSNAFVRGGTDFGTNDLVYGTDTKHQGQIVLDTFGGTVTGSGMTALIRVRDGGRGVIEDELSASAGTSIQNMNGTAYYAPTEEYLPIHAVRAQGSADQAITSGSITRVQYDVIAFDNQGDWDTTNHKYVASKGGRYRLGARTRFLAPSAGTELEMFLRINGSSKAVTEKIVDGGDETIDCSTLVKLSAGDEFTAAVRHNEGVDLTIDLNSAAYSSATVQKL